jgi:hypothetical protein
VPGNGHAGCGRRLGETDRWKHRQGAPGRPHFYCLEEVMEVWLLNAAHMKAVPGRKSDVRDAEWIAQLLEHGLLAPSFVPPPQRLQPDHHCERGAQARQIHSIPPAIATMPSTIAVVARGSLGWIHTGFGGIGTWEE